VVRLRDVTSEDVEEDWTVRKNGVNLDTPTFLREGKGLPDSLEERSCKREKRGIFRQIPHKGESGLSNLSAGKSRLTRSELPWFSSQRDRPPRAQP